MADRIQPRRDTAARWAAANPVLLEGEWGVVTDSPSQYKIGDGVTAWNDLPLRGYDGTLVQTTGNGTQTVMSQKATTEAISATEQRIGEEITDLSAEVSGVSAEIYGVQQDLVGTIQEGNINNGGGISSSSAYFHMLYDLSALDKSLTIHVETTYKGAYSTLWALYSEPYDGSLGNLIAKGDLTSVTQSADIDLSSYPNANYLYLEIGESGNEAVAYYQKEGLKEDIEELSKTILGQSVTLDGETESGNLNNGGGISSSNTSFYKIYNVSELDKSILLKVSTTAKSEYTSLWALHSEPYSISSGLITLVAKGDLTSVSQTDTIDLSQYPTAKYLYVAVGAAGNKAEVTYEAEGLAKSVYKETFAKLVELTNKPAISWVDDDFTGVGYDGSISEQYQVVHDWCVANGIKCDFAIIPDAPLESMTAKLAVAKEWENENFNFLFHPVHSEGWYNYNESNPHDIENVKRSIVTGIRKIRDYGLLCPLDILVWPGNSHTFNDNIEVVKNYMDMAISVTQDINHAADSPRYKIARIGIERLNKGMTMTDIKAIIDDAVANGDWMIFYTHIHSIVIANEVTETGFTTANLFELLRYANDRVQIRPSAAIWRERKILWEMSGK